MNKIILCLLGVLLLFQEHTCGEEEVENQCDTKEFKLIINEISSFIKEDFAKKYNIKFLREPDVVTRISKPTLKFQILGPFSKEKLRLILTEGIEKFIKLVNSSEKLRPFIGNHSFSVNEINAGIVLKDKNNKFLHHPNIATVALIRGKIYFSTMDEKIEYYGYRTTEEENYEEALKLVISSKNK